MYDLYQPRKLKGKVCLLKWLGVQLDGLVSLHLNVFTIKNWTILLTLDKLYCHKYLH